METNIYYYFTFFKEVIFKSEPYPHWDQNCVSYSYIDAWKLLRRVIAYLAQVF